MVFTSPFQRIPGTFKFGDYTYEWRSLLETPCYGFNGPNACYSSTCKHDGATSNRKQQHQSMAAKKTQKLFNKQKSSSKFPMKFNLRAAHFNGSDGGGSSSNSSSCSSINGDDECMVNDYRAAKSLLTEQMNTYDKSSKFYGSGSSSSSSSLSSMNGDGERMVYDNVAVNSFLTEQMNVRSNIYDKSSKFYCYEPIQQFFNTSPMIDLNIKSRSSAYYSEPSVSTTTTSSSPTFIHSDRSYSESSYDDGASLDSSYDTASRIEYLNSGKNSNKTHAFNPLSKPFHPMKMNNRSVTNQLGVVPCTPTGTVLTENPSKFESTTVSTIFPNVFCQPNKYVCILCPKTFCTATELQQHIENKAKQPNDCVICGKTFTHGYQLQRHLWIHLKNHRRIRSFNCRACQKKFRSFNQLHKHYELCQYKLYIFF